MAFNLSIVPTFPSAVDAGLAPHEAVVLDAISPVELVETLGWLINIPSVSGSDAESEIQHALAARLTALDLDTDLWPLDLDELRGSPGFPGWEAERGEAWGVAAASGQGHPALVLQGHVDVVPPGTRASWHGDPFVAQVDGDRVQGRGACDMKAGLAANLLAAKAVLTSGVALERPFALHCVVGEEDGGLGAFATLRRGHKGEACIISEPTSGTMVTANSGALTFEITVQGAATHASTAWAGVNAIDAFLPLYKAMTDLARRRNARRDPLMADYPLPHALSIGSLRCGDWASTVPDHLVAEGRLGVALDEDPNHAREELEEAVALAARGNAWLRRHPPTIRWHGGQFASGRYDSTSGLLDIVSGAHGAVTRGDRPRERGATYGSDLRLYAAAGIPTLHYGPGDVRQAHGPDESVSVEGTLRCARVLALSIMRSCTS